MEDLSQGIEFIPTLGPPRANSFKYVKSNVPGAGCDLHTFMEELEGCSCDKAGSCSGDSCSCFHIFGQAYANGFLLESAFSPHKPARSIIECGKNCKCEMSICSLRLVQKGIQKKLRVIETVEKGYGLMTEDEIAYLAFVCEYAGEVVSESEAQKRLQESQQTGNMNYLIAVKECSDLSQNKTFVDPRLVGNIGRFINHSCDPNLIMIPVRVNHCVPRLALFARRKIFSGEELTFDYSGCTFLNADSPVPNKSNVMTHSQSLITRQISDISQNYSFKETNSIGAEYENEEEIIKKRKIDQEPSPKSSKDTSISHLKSSSCGKEFCVNPDQTLGMESSSCDIACIMRSEQKKNDNFINLSPVGESLSAHPFHNQRTKCFCGSKNCSGYLPYDSHLFEAT